jgi:alkylhydroperoxidase family enzyme
MARISGADPSKQGLLSGLLTRIVYGLTKRKLGRLVMPVRIAAHHSKILWGYGQMEQSLLGSRLVDAGLKDLAQLRVATLVGCPFWIDIGSAVSRTRGISEEKMVALPQYKSSALFSETERPVLEYADAMTQTPVEVPDALFAKLREKFTDAQLVELTATLAWENYRARFDHALGVEAEGFRQGSYCAMVRGEAKAQTQHHWRKNARLIWLKGYFAMHLSASADTELLAQPWDLRNP